MLLNPYNTIDGCPNCKVIYVTDDESTGEPSQPSPKEYSDDILIKWLIKRTKEKKLDWIGYQGYMEDHYPFVLDTENARIILTYNGRNIEFQMFWKFVPPPKHEYPKPKTDENTEGNEITEQEWRPPYGWDYVIPVGIEPPAPNEPVVYIKFTEEDIEAVFERWDYRKPFRVLTSDWFNSLFELNTVVKEYCNKWVRKTTHYVDRYKETRNGLIDFLEEME